MRFEPGTSPGDQESREEVQARARPGERTVELLVDLPDGWTRSTACIGELATGQVCLSLLWEPPDGPLATNAHVQVHSPTCFNARICEHADDPVRGTRRGCASTTWAGMSWQDGQVRARGADGSAGRAPRGRSIEGRSTCATGARGGAGGVDQRSA